MTVVGKIYGTSAGCSSSSNDCPLGWVGGDSGTPNSGNVEIGSCKIGLSLSSADISLAKQ